MQLKRILMLLAAVFLLSSCAARYDYTNGIALRLRDTKGDKYTAEVWVDVAFEDGSRPIKVDLSKIIVSDKEALLMSGGIQEYWQGTPKNVITFKLTGRSINGLNNEDCTLIVQNVTADGKEYPGQWELPITIQNEERPALFSAAPKNPENADNLVFKRIEITPFSFYFEAEGKKLKNDHEVLGKVDVLLSNGEKALCRGSNGRVEGDKPFTLLNVLQFTNEIDVDSVAGFIADGVEYTLTKVED